MNSAAKSPLVSVIVPAWNAGQTIAETLDSVRAQTFSDYEVIIVDDGSSDETAEIARRFCAADLRFTLVKQPNQGVSAARNLALDRARGEYIAFLDADDVWLPQKLAKQLELFRQEPQANLVFTNYFHWDGQKNLNIFFRDDRPLPFGPAGRQLIQANLYIPSVVMVRRALLPGEGCHFTTGISGCADWDMWLQLLEHGLYATGTREPLVRYRIWEGNMSKRKLEMFTEGVTVLETRLNQTKVAELRPIYRQTVAFARARLELARARQQLEIDPATVPSLIWRAWRFYPRRVKWLLWLTLVKWPEWLAGKRLRNIVYRKPRTKF
jgi:glycosyltransferase involved in cell wall biosynthesis